MKGLAESSPFHLLTNPHVINRFIFGHGVVIYYLSYDKFHIVPRIDQPENPVSARDSRISPRNTSCSLIRIFKLVVLFFWLHRPVCVRPGRKPRRPGFRVAAQFL